MTESVDLVYLDPSFNSTKERDTMTRSAMGIAVALGVAVAGCGGNTGANPSGPTQTTVQSVTVSSLSDLLFLGVTETFTATATTSSGGSQPVTSGWGTDAPTVASVESGTGRVTGVGSGMVTVFVDYQGRRGTKLIRVLPNYQGVWSGSYFVTACSQTGQMASVGNPCGSTFAVNRVLPFSFTMTQTRDAVTAQIALGTIAGSGSGPVQTDGQLFLVGTVSTGSLSFDTQWSMASTQPGRITGTGNFIERSTGLTGEARIAVNIRDLNRTQ